MSHTGKYTDSKSANTYMSSQAGPSSSQGATYQRTEAPPDYTETDKKRDTMDNTAAYTQDPYVIGLCKSNGIGPFCASQTGRIANLDRVDIILDDSWSMRNLLTFPVEGCTTRWELMKKQLHDNLTLAPLAKEVNVYSLNRMKNAPIKLTSSNGKTVDETCLSDLREFFEEGPFYGQTPTMELLDKTMVMPPGQELSVLTLLFTDGEPDGGMDRFLKYMTAKHKGNPGYGMEIGLVTDEETVVEMYETRFDDEVPRLGVSRIASVELKEIKAKQGRDFPITRFDMPAVFWLSALVQEIDDLDSKKFSDEKMRLIITYAQTHDFEEPRITYSDTGSKSGGFRKGMRSIIFGKGKDRA